MAHPSQESIVVAQKFMQHMPAESSATQLLDGSYRSRVMTDGTHLLSYGHWQIAYHGARDDVDGFDTLYITTDQYQTGEWPKSGKPKYSPTTDGHIRAVAGAAHAAGFMPREQTQTRVNGHGEDRHYQLYTRKS